MLNLYESHPAPHIAGFVYIEGKLSFLLPVLCRARSLSVGRSLRGRLRPPTMAQVTPVNG